MVAIIFTPTIIAGAGLFGANTFLNISPIRIRKQLILYIKNLTYPNLTPFFDNSISV